MTNPEHSYHTQPSISQEKAHMYIHTVLVYFCQQGERTPSLAFRLNNKSKFTLYYLIFFLLKTHPMCDDTSI